MQPPACVNNYNHLFFERRAVEYSRPKDLCAIVAFQKSTEASAALEMRALLRDRRRKFPARGLQMFRPAQ